MFLGGRFTRKRPTRPGLYPVRGRDGGTVDPRQWRRIGEDGKEIGLAPGEPGWQGDWYDRPVPPVCEDV